MVELVGERLTGALLECPKIAQSKPLGDRLRTPKNGRSLKTVFVTIRQVLLSQFQLCLLKYG